MSFKKKKSLWRNSQKTCLTKYLSPAALPSWPKINCQTSLLYHHPHTEHDPSSDVPEVSSVFISISCVQTMLPSLPYSLHCYWWSSSPWVTSLVDSYISLGNPTVLATLQESQALLCVHTVAWPVKPSQISSEAKRQMLWLIGMVRSQFENVFLAKSLGFHADLVDTVQIRVTHHGSSYPLI